MNNEENNNNNKNNFEEFNIITLGDPGVGKTSIFKRFLDDGFDHNQLSTLGVSFSSKVITINKRNLLLKLTDTGGQEKYRSIAASYFWNVDVVLFVFDLNNEKSFKSIQYWFDFFEQNNSGRKIKNKYLIGNKNDLEQKIEQESIDELTEKNNILYMSTSAKDNYQIEQLFNYIGGELCNYLDKNNEKNKGKNNSKGKVLSKTDVNKKKSKCC